MDLNILVVDDSQMVRAVIAKTLQLSQVPVKELFQAANGKEALDILGDNWIDLVFADINMPVMTGVEMIEIMHKDGLLQTVPVIIISSDGSSTRMDQLKAKGVTAYIRKPFTPELLKSVVDDILGVKHAN